MKRLILLLALLVLAGCASLYTNLLKARDIVGLPSMQEMWPGVYVGNWADRQDIENLKAHKVKVCINLAWEIRDPGQSWPLKAQELSFKDGILFMKDGMVDYASPDNERLLKDAVGMAVQSLKAHLIVMGGCEGARNRTYLWLICLRMKLFGETAAVAEQKILAVRPEMALHGWEDDLLAKIEKEGVSQWLAAK